jgi:type IV secretory pathway VirJ component
VGDRQVQGGRFARALLACALCAALALPGGASAAEETLSFGAFGTVTLHRAAPRPSRVVLLVSGDGGWDAAAAELARGLAAQDALVVGIDLRRYLANQEELLETCATPAADLAALGAHVQKKLGYPAPVPPILVGLATGGVVVYAALVQAPRATFGGALSLGFCPDLQLAKPFCHGTGDLAWKPLRPGKAIRLLPASGLESPWVVFPGPAGAGCEAAVTEAFAAKVPQASFQALPDSGSGSAAPSAGLPPQVAAAFTGLAARAAASAAARTGKDGGPASQPIDGLPVVEVPVAAPARATVAVFLSGDGGWSGVEREIAAALAGAGVPVAGLNTLQYFWSPKGPDAASADLQRILRHYLELWKVEKAVLVGYSLGADVLPSMAARLPEDLRKRVSLIALLAPGRRAQFEFRILDWVASGGGKGGIPLLPEIDRLAGTPLLCLDEAGAADSLCPTLRPGQGKAVTIKGGRNLGGDYQGIARQILDALP